MSSDVYAPLRPVNNNLRLAVALVILAGFYSMALGIAWHITPQDLSALFMAGHLYETGHSHLIYATPERFFDGSPPQWAPFLPALGLSESVPLPYIYPPLWATILGPLSNLGPQTFYRLFAVIELAMLAGSIGLAWRLCRGFAMPLWGWVAISAALLYTSSISFVALIHLQPQIIVVFLTLLAFERYSVGKFATAGVILGIAAALKLAPAGLILIFLLDRNWRAMAAFTIVCVTFAALSLIVMGPDLHWSFLASMAAASEGVLITTVNYSFEVLLHGLFDTFDTSGRGVTVADTAYIPILAKATLLTALGWMLLKTHALPATHRLPARLLLLGTLLNLFGPLSWSHYFLLQLFLLPALIGLVPFWTGAILCAGVALTTSREATVLFKGAFEGDFAGAALGATTMCVLFVVVTATLRRSPLRTAPA